LYANRPYITYYTTFCQEFRLRYVKPALKLNRLQVLRPGDGSGALQDLRWVQGRQFDELPGQV